MTTMMTKRADPICGPVLAFYVARYVGWRRSAAGVPELVVLRPLPEVLDAPTLILRNSLTQQERTRYRARRAEKRAEWRENNPQYANKPAPALLHRVQQCNTCGVVRHRDRLSCDNMMLFVLYALVMGSFSARPPYMNREAAAAARAAAAAQAAADAQVDDD